VGIEYPAFHGRNSPPLPYDPQRRLLGAYHVALEQQAAKNIVTELTYRHVLENRYYVIAFNCETS